MYCYCIALDFAAGFHCYELFIGSLCIAAGVAGNCKHRQQLKYVDILEAQQPGHMLSALFIVLYTPEIKEDSLTLLIVI